MTWLFGLDLLVKLRSMLLFALYGSRFDMRDWMETRPFDFSRASGETGEFWFDYVADTGDGGQATYAVARMCLADLRAEGPLQPGTVLESRCIPDQGGGALREPQPTGKTILPRGHFLIVGGDTAYHVADYATLAERFQKPFCAAARALGIDENSPRRPLFGLPANHDYYDVLDGFARQFRYPLYGESGNVGSEFPPPQLRLHGFERLQTASYAALQLPFQWWLWSVDCEIGHVDIRQQKFFRDLGRPERLIVLTPEPSIVYGRRAREQDKTTRAFRALGLQPRFLDGAGDGTRQDLSGDVHHYERYFGPPNNPLAPSAANYASVVCGLGGAFLHPSTQGAGEILPQRVHPAPREALRAVAPRLLNPWWIARGGFVWLIGSLVATLLYAAIARFGAEAAAAGPSAATIPGARSGYWAGLGRILESLADRYSDVLAVVIALLVLAAWTAMERKLPEPLGTDAAAGGKGRPFWATPLGMMLATGGAVTPGLLVFGGVWGPEPEGSSALGAGAVFVASLYWSLMAIIVSVLRRERLFRRARDVPVSRADYAPNALALSAAVLGPALVTWRFGATHTAASLAFSALVLGTVSLVGLALVALAVLAGAAKLPARSKAMFVLLGAHHAAAQLAYPQIVIGWGNPLTLALVILGSVVLGLFALHVAYRGSRLGVLAIWLCESMLVVGTTLLTAPHMAPFAGWGAAPGALLAAAVGAVSSCASFGAYLLVALVFGGHANEVGAATGVENFKGILRVKLTEQALTAYVIASDDPAGNPRVIDIVSLPTGSVG